MVVTTSSVVVCGTDVASVAIAVSGSGTTAGNWPLSEPLPACVADGALVALAASGSGTTPGTWPLCGPRAVPLAGSVTGVIFVAILSRVGVVLGVMRRVSCLCWPPEELDSLSSGWVGKVGVVGVNGPSSSSANSKVSPRAEGNRGHIKLITQ